MQASVLIPTYNGAWCIERTLRSVMGQTLQDFEVIVIDDGSSDETVEVARACVGDDPRFRIIVQPNAGVAATRNHALQLARGKYLAPLDHDDVWCATYLEETIGALERSGERAVMAFARSIWIDGDDRTPPQTPMEIPERVDYRELLRRNPLGNGSCMVARREALQRIGFDVELCRRYGQADDWWAQLQLSWLGDVVFVDAPLVKYRITCGTVSHTQIWRMTLASLEIIRRARRLGPPLRRRDYMDARSLMLLWQMRRARASGQRRLAFALGALAYAGNPLWFLERDLRDPVWRRLTRPWRAKGSDLWRDLLDAPALTAPESGTPPQTATTPTSCLAGRLRPRVEGAGRP